VRNFLVAVALLFGVVFIITQFSEVQEIIETLKRGDWRFLTLAALVQAAWFANVAFSFWVIYRLLGLEESPLELVKTATAAIFLNVVAPSGGMGGVAVFIAQARQRGYSSGRAAIAASLYIFFDYLGFLSILALGLLVLFRRNNLDAVEIAASIIMLLIFLGMSILLYLAMRSEAAFGRTLVWLARRINAVALLLGKHDFLSEERAYTFARDAAEGLTQLRQAPRGLLKPAILGLTNKTLMLTLFALMFLAFNIPYSPGTIVAGFSTSFLFTVVSPTPSGIGVVEGLLTLTLRSLNVSLEAAAVVTLAYRGYTFWIPLLVGMLAFRRLGGTRKEAEME
jgi:glycosyltransferase 2 family protein